MGQTPSVMQIIGGIEAARAEGLISSEVMKHRFVGKVIVYILCVLAAVLVDLAMITLHQPVWAVPMVAGDVYKRQMVFLSRAQYLILTWSSWVLL